MSLRKSRLLFRPHITSGVSSFCLASYFSLPAALILCSACTPGQMSRPQSADEFESAHQIDESTQDEFEEMYVPDVPLPEPMKGGKVSLEAILAYADRNAPQLSVARERLGLGDAAAVAASPFLPDNPNVSMAVGPGMNSVSNHVDLSASLSQRIEIAGERGLRIKAADRTRERLRAELDETRWEIHRGVHAIFHRALIARERLAAAERLLTFQERLLEIARGRARAGDISPLPVRLAEGELSQAQVARIGAEQGYVRAKLQLGAVAGWPAGSAPEPLGALDEPLEPPESAVLVAIARSHQPRLRTLQAGQREALAQLRVADRDGWPEPTIGLQVNRENYRDNPPETQVQGVLTLPIPVFQRNQGERATAQAQSRIAVAEQEAFESQLVNLIEQNRTAVAAAAAQVKTYGREILPTFEENLRLIQRAFELGEIDILQVSVARERFLRMQTDALDAYVEYFQATADLEASIGADAWPSARHEPVSEEEIEP